MLKQLFTGLAGLALAGAASAADLPPAVPDTRAPVVVPQPLYNWGGFYLGAMGGGGWTTGQGPNLKGGFAGGTLGGNAQFSNVVIGAELEGAWSGLKASAAFGPFSATDNFQAFGSATARAGVAINNLLIYGKGGYAYSDYNQSLTLGGVPQAFLLNGGHHDGYTVGAGLEYMFAQNWSAKVEYQYYDFGKTSFVTPAVLTGFGSTRNDEHTVKAGINYHFNWGGPVVAKY